MEITRKGHDFIFRQSYADSPTVETHPATIDGDTLVVYYGSPVHYGYDKKADALFAEEDEYFTRVK